MNRKLVIAGGVGAAVLGAFALGRFSRAPARVETKVEYRDRVVEKKVEGPVRVRTMTHEIPGPQGPERIVERVVERGPVTTDTSTESQGSAESAGRTVVTVEQPRWMAGVTAGSKLTDPLHLTWGGELKYRAAGPLWVGAAANARGEFNLSLSLAF